MNVNLKQIIHKSGMKQYAIAERAGMTEFRLSKIINGRGVATEEELQKLAEALHVSVSLVKEHAS